MKGPLTFAKIKSLEGAGFLWRRWDPVLADCTRRVEAVGPTTRDPGSAA